MKKVVEDGKIVEYYTESEVKIIVEYLSEITKRAFEKVGIKIENAGRNLDKISSQKHGRGIKKTGK